MSITESLTKMEARNKLGYSSVWTNNDGRIQVSH